MKTNAQLGVLTSTTEGGLLERARYADYRWYKKVEAMRNDPTLSLVRRMFAAPILIAPWTVVANDEAPDGAKEFIEKAIMPWRSTLLTSALRGAIFDYGWQPFEIVVDPLKGLQKVKPLIQRKTTIRTDPRTGAYRGLRQGTQWEGVSLEPEESLLISHDVEGTDWYGRGLTFSAEPAYDAAQQNAKSQGAYDKKIAGSHWVIKYPVGFTPQYNGYKNVDNQEVARGILAALESSGSVVVPKVEEMLDDAEGWEIDLIGDTSSSASSLLDRADYLDRLKVRAFGFPERSILEGQHGTKADAGEHGNFAISALELTHLGLLEPINWHLINRLMEFEYGPEYADTVTVEPAPIVDAALTQLRDMYKALLADPATLMNEASAIDTAQIRSRLNLPDLEEEEQVETPPVTDLLDELANV